MTALVRDAAYAKGEAELDTTVQPHVRVINGIMDNDPRSPAGVVVNGRLDLATLRFIKADDYQRAIDHRADIWQALRDGTVLPNVEIGVRGTDFDTEGKNGLVIRSPCYIVDGQQRIGNALKFLEVNPQEPVRLFATIHFNTTREWETKRFDDLNKKRKKVSPNHHMRNMRHENRAILTLYGLCKSDKSSPLYDRVSWDQNMKRTDLMSALTVAMAVVFLHRHLVGHANRTAEALSDCLMRLQEKISLQIMRRNTVTFFALVDQLWPFADITHRLAAPQIKGQFLMQLATLLSKHEVFWAKDDKELVVDNEDRKKLGRFPINDPQVRQLAATSGPARELLYGMMLQHLNSGRRQHRLVERVRPIANIRGDDE